MSDQTPQPEAVETPKAVSDPVDQSTGDFSDTSAQPKAPVDAPSAPTKITKEADATATADDYKEHFEPFWVPLGLRKAQKRDTVVFGLFAILAIVAGAFALYFVNPIGRSAAAPSWVLPLTVVLTGAGVLGVLIFGFMAIYDLTRAERAFTTSTHDWLQNRYGLSLSKHKVRALGKGRRALAGTTGWKLVNLEGYPQGVQITHTDRYGYRLITTVDGQESQLPRSAS